MTSMLDALKKLQSRGISLNKKPVTSEADPRIGVFPEDIYVSPGPTPDPSLTEQPPATSPHPLEGDEAPINSRHVETDIPEVQEGTQLQAQLAAEMLEAAAETWQQEEEALFPEEEAEWAADDEELAADSLEPFPGLESVDADVVGPPHSPQTSGSGESPSASASSGSEQHSARGSQIESGSVFEDPYEMGWPGSGNDLADAGGRSPAESRRTLPETGSNELSRDESADLLGPADGPEVPAEAFVEVEVDEDSIGPRPEEIGDLSTWSLDQGLEIANSSDEDEAAWLGRDVSPADVPPCDVGESGEVQASEAPAADDCGDEVRESAVSPEISHADMTDVRDQLCRLESLVVELLEKPSTIVERVITTDQGSEEARQFVELVEEMPNRGSKDAGSDDWFESDQVVDIVEAATEGDQVTFNDDFGNEHDLPTEANTTVIFEDVRPDLEAATFVTELAAESLDIDVEAPDADEPEELMEKPELYFTPPQPTPAATWGELNDEPRSLKVVNLAQPVDFDRELGDAPSCSAEVASPAEFVSHLNTVSADGTVKPGQPPTPEQQAQLDQAAYETSEALTTHDAVDSARSQILSLLDARETRDATSSPDDATSAVEASDSEGQPDGDGGATAPSEPMAPLERVLPETTAFEVVLRDNLDDPDLATQYRSIWKATVEASKGKHHLALAVYGCEQERHTSQVLAQLGCFLSQRQSTRILLVDGNLSAQTLSKSFQLTERPGLAEIISGTRDWQECVVATASPNLFLLPAGIDEAQPLPGESVADGLRSLASDFDFILIDAGHVGAPLMPSLVGAADRSLLVVRLGKTKREEAQAAIARLRELKLGTHGCIITNV